LDFIHVESIHRRSSANDWTIRPHAHPDQHQILVLTKGAGTVRLEEREHTLRPGTIVTVPSPTVHAFRFEPGSDGFVVTVAMSFCDDCLEGNERLASLFSGHGRCFDSADADHEALAEPFRQLDREFVWPAAGRRLAIKAYLQLILVTVVRLDRQSEEIGERTRHRDADIVVRYRELVERSFRHHGSLDEFASNLGVTTSRLNIACRACIGKSAMAIMHDRIMIEAKRHLLYTGMTVSEIALLLGFQDPAYFNRFFSRRAGVPPGGYRISHASYQGFRTMTP